MNDLPRAIYNVAVMVLRRLGRDAFSRSQSYVPVRTGRLRSSGRLVEVTGGFKISYKTPYAARRELGLPSGTVISVRRHRFKNGWRGPYQYVSKGEPPAYYVKRALDEELPKFAQQFIAELLKRRVF